MDNKKNNIVPSKNLHRTKLDWFGLVMMFVLLICSLAVFARAMATNMLSTGYMVLIMVLLLVLNGLHIFVQLPLRRNKLGKLICSILAVILSIAMIYGTVAVGAIQSALNKISGILIEKQITAVIVMADDDAVSVGDTYGYTYGILSKSDSANTNTLLDIIEKEIHTVDTNSYDSPAALATALYDDEVQAIILNEGYISVLEGQEDFADFGEKTKIIYEYVTEQEIAPTKSTGSITKQPFVVYLSGSDERHADINAKSLSDVNILAVVNPKTRQILLINTPRDYYLPLAFNGEMDKLTHAGIYGVQESMAVLDNLYGTETAYYGRINFWGLIDIVDALDGIDVYNDEEFSTVSGDVAGYSYSSYYYPEGMNHLNGIEALTFARERQSFNDGDNKRGQNQMKVIKAIIDKATSPSILSKYQNLLNAVSDNFITNVSYDQIASLVQMMQKNGGTWNIQSMSATQGYGNVMQYCFSAGSEAWVMPPDIDSINQIKDVIAQVMNGEEIVLPTNEE